VDSKTLIDEYMRVKNYTQYKQMAADIGISTPYLAEINLGRKEFTDKTAIYIAKECGLDPEEVVINLAVIRARDEDEKNVWKNLAKKYSAELRGALGAALLVAMNPATNEILTSLKRIFC
jgi:transcriptional regulator with XRE-family HTH domain